MSKKFELCSVKGTILNIQIMEDNKTDKLDYKVINHQNLRSPH